MISSKRAEMLEKVRKLMSMARHERGNEHEQETALRQANKLMAEHGIAEAECDMLAIEADAMEFGEELVGTDGKQLREGKVYRNIPVFASVLGVGIARFTGTIVIIKMTEYGKVFAFRGEVSDNQLAIWLFDCLIRSIQNTQKQSCWTRRSEATIFRKAAASSLQKRLRALALEREQLYREANRATGSKALAVADIKMLKLSELYGKQQTTPSGIRSNSGAYTAGHLAGNSINIPTQRPLGNSGNQKMLGRS